MNAIVDVQGFKTEDNIFIVKEVAIFSNNRHHVFLIKPPFPFFNLTEAEKRQVRWIERNRKIYWNSGDIPYKYLKTLVAAHLKDKTVYCKGLEKTSWIRDMMGWPKAYNLEEKGCPSLFDLYSKYISSENVFSCINHSAVCALKNVLCLRNWCLDNKLDIVQ